MPQTLNAQTLQKLVSKYKDAPDYLSEIFESLKSFEEYHSAIFKMETTRIVFGGDLRELDKARTNCHNLVIGSVRRLNEWAEAAGLEPVYSGAVSKERPHRTVLADAVLPYVEEVVRNRSRGR